ncbi:hypothetical protein [Paraburkholderia adhaesiva]|uniref:hypothetical protein n=1 Tax=Paraburkholderia adhaesiva TaxID=2883244 RepID=UPI001F3269F1|nr:hypothetical protein [Paraburkholderia adhaesiva]
MDRYWETNALATAPPVPSGTSGTYPTDGNPATVTPPTTPGQWWYHQITEEIRNAIVKLGGVPDFTKVDQLANAILASVSESISNATGQLAKVATTGSYNDLTNKPTIPAAQVNSDWNASSGVAAILNKPAVQAPLGFTPVQQGGGIGQVTNKVYIGWDGGGLRATIDSSDEGHFVFEAELQANVANLQNEINSAVSNAWTPNNLQPLTLGGIGNFIIIGSALGAGQMITNPSVRPGGPTLAGTWMGCGEFSSGSDTFSLCVRVA